MPSKASKGWGERPPEVKGQSISTAQLKHQVAYTWQRIGINYYQRPSLFHVEIFGIVHF